MQQIKMPEETRLEFVFTKLIAYFSYDVLPVIDDPLGCF